MKKLSLIFIAMLIAMPAQAWFWQNDEKIPQVSLPDLQGKLLNLPDDVKGQVLLVHFLGMDCHFCDKNILPALELLYQKYKAQGFVPLVVNVGKLDKTNPHWQKFTAVTFPVLQDERGLVAKKFGMIALPTTFVIDSNGIIQKKLTGAAKIEEYEALITPFLQQGETYENKPTKP
jgi:peroxiredoxin